MATERRSTSWQTASRTGGAERAGRVDRDEGVDHGRIERLATSPEEQPDRLGRTQCRAVRAFARHRDERVGHAEDAGALGNVARGQPIRVAGAVPALVMRTHDPRRVTEERERREDRLAEDRVPADDLALLGVERTGGLE